MLHSRLRCPVLRAPAILPSAGGFHLNGAGAELRRRFNTVWQRGMWIKRGLFPTWCGL